MPTKPPVVNPALARLAAIKSRTGSGDGVSLSKREQMIPGAEFTDPLIVLGIDPMKQSITAQVASYTKPTRPLGYDDSHDWEPPTIEELTEDAVQEQAARELAAKQAEGVGAVQPTPVPVLKAVAEARTNAIPRLDTAIKQQTLIEVLDVKTIDDRRAADIVRMIIVP